MAALPCEERDLIAQFGERYRWYREEVGMLLPWRRRMGAANRQCDHRRRRVPPLTSICAGAQFLPYILIGGLSVKRPAVIAGTIRHHPAPSGTIRHSS